MEKKNYRHNDIRTENIMITEDKIKIGDFGHCKALPEPESENAKDNSDSENSESEKDEKSQKSGNDSGGEGESD